MSTHRGGVDQDEWDLLGGMDIYDKSFRVTLTSIATLWDQVGALIIWGFVCAFSSEWTFEVVYYVLDRMGCAHDKSGLQ